MLILAQYGLRHGVDIEVNWPGRISVFPIMGGIWLALLAPGWVATALVVWGLVMAIIATVLYARSGLRAVRAVKAASSAPDPPEPST
jgi:cardiolipin synthase